MNKNIKSHIGYNIIKHRFKNPLKNIYVIYKSFIFYINLCINYICIKRHGNIKLNYNDFISIYSIKLFIRHMMLTNPYIKYKNC